MCNCDTEYPEITNTVRRTAKKNHVCGVCKFPIEIGQQYEFTKWLIDSKWTEIKVCRECLAVSGLVEAETGCNPCSYEDINEDALALFCEYDNETDEYSIISGLVQFRSVTPKGYPTIGVNHGPAIEIHRAIKERERADFEAARSQIERCDRVNLKKM